MERLTHFVARVARAAALRPALALAIALVACAGAGGLSRSVGFAAEVEVWLDEDDPARVTYRRFLDTFGVDEALVVGLFGPPVFAADTLERLRALEARLRAIPGVAEVRGLAGARSFGAGEALIEPVLPAGRIGPGAAESAWRRWAADPALAGWVAADGRATAVLVGLGDPARSMEAKLAVVDAVGGAAAELFPDAERELGGTPAIAAAILRYSRADLGTVGLLGLALVLLMAAAGLRSPVLAAAPALVIIPALVLLTGVMGALELDFTLVSQALLTLLVAAGTADAIHLGTAYREQLREGRPKLDAIAEAAGQTALPCAFTTLTTAAGMLALTASPLAPIRQLGALGALGVGLAFLISFGLLPAVFALAPAPRPRRGADLIGRTLALGLAGARRAPRSVVGLAGLVTAGSLALASQVRVGAEPLAYFAEADPVRQGAERIDRALHGSTRIELSVRPVDPEAPWLDARRARALEEMAAWLETLPAVTGVEGVHTPLAGLGFALTGTRAAPRGDAGVEQALLLLESEPALARVLTPTEARPASRRACE